MDYNDRTDNSRFQAADYRVRLFLSVDLSGSTAFKNSSKGQDRSEGLSPKWVTVFESFYNDFPDRYRSNYQSHSTPLAGADRCPSLWKAVGDELVFCGRVTTKRSVVLALTSFMKTLIDYRKTLLDADLDLNLKGAGWLAAFPEPNRAVQMRRATDVVSFLSASEALEAAADDRPFEYDFLGKAIDTGFRIAAKAQPDRFALSVQLARLLINPQDGMGFDRDIYIDRPVEMKGVNRGMPYPLLYIETLEHLPIARVREQERAILASSSAPRKPQLNSYLSAYCDVAGTDEIMLPQDAQNQAWAPPESYTEHRDMISEHLDLERGREFEDRGALANDPPPADGAEELPSEEDLEPIVDKIFDRIHWVRERDT